jgi:two-component system nitrogen regulation response regulator NtrX
MEHQHKILFVDGDNDILRTYKEFFKKRGFIVEVAHNGIQGLEKLRHRKFSVALVAIKVPKMNGIEIIKMAKEEEIETKIVILSGEGEGNRNDAIAAVNLGVSAWFEKSPSIMGDLLKKVQELSELMSFDEIDRFISSLHRQN